MQTEPITIAVVSDVACPWCYIGKRRLESALEQWQGTPVEITWHPFELDPTIPVSGLDGNTYLTSKFGDLEKSKAMIEHITNLGAEVNIEFNFGEKWVAVNTLSLHQLLHVAGQEGFKPQLKERFLRAYFTENLHLNVTEVLIEIMAEFGWDAKKTKEIIADDNIAYAVKQEIAHYQKLGVSGVPFFIINNQFGISGAQPSTVFLEAFEQLAPQKHSKAAESCGLDGDNC